MFKFSGPLSCRHIQISVSCFLLLGICALTNPAMAQLGLCGAGSACSCTGDPLTDVSACSPSNPDYFLCRALEFQSKMPTKWHMNDILIMGDSITDFSRIEPEFTPIVPNSFNVAVMGSKTDDVGNFLSLFDNVISAEFPPRVPSKIVVRVGTNDLIAHLMYNAYDHCLHYYTLLEKLQAFKTKHGNNMKIYICAIPPGDPTPPAGAPTTFVADYKILVPSANALLKTTCQIFGFTFIDDYSKYLTSDGQLNTALFAINRLPGTNDRLHFGCAGQRLYQNTLMSELGLQSN